MKKTRNKFEEKISKALPSSFEYETIKLTYTPPPRTYLPDWYDKTRNIVVEAKGRWDAAERAKSKLVREQHPDLRCIMVFCNPAATISKNSKTTYEQYAKKIGWEVMSLDEIHKLVGNL